MKNDSKNLLIYTSLLIFLSIFIVFTVLMKPSFYILNESAYNIVHFEFMWNYETYQMIMNSWSDNEISAAITNTFYDFGWLVGYGGLVFIFNYLLAQKFLKKTKMLLYFAAYSGVVASIFDAFENIILLNLLKETQLVFGALPFMVSIIALIKFLFIGSGISIFIFMLIIFIIKKIKPKSKIHI